MSRNGSQAGIIIAILLLTSIIPQVVLAAPVTGALPTAGGGLAAHPAAPEEFGPAYAHQFAVLQNPVMDPGFELGNDSPFWIRSNGDTIANGALSLADGSHAAQPFAFTTEATPFPTDVDEAVRDLQLGLAVSPYTNAESLTLTSTGPGSAVLYFVEDATGKPFGGVAVPFRSGTNHLDATSFLATDAAGQVLYLDGASTGLTPADIMPASHPLWLEIHATDGPVTVDDVVLDGVEYGAPRAHVELDGLRVSDGVDPVREAALAALEEAAAGAGVTVESSASEFAHDGYALLVLPLEFRTDLPAGGVDVESIQATTGTWRFAVFLVEYAPSGTRIVDATVPGDASLTLSTSPWFDAHGAPAFPRGLVESSDTPYKALFENASLSGTGVVFRATETLATGLFAVASWKAPADDGGLYVADEARGFFNPQKIAAFALPVADALDPSAGSLSALVGSVPCPDQSSLTYRFGNADCDRDGSFSETACMLDTESAIPSIRFLAPNPADPASHCLDPDGDGLWGDYDPHAYDAGALTLDVDSADAAEWWNGVRNAEWSGTNSFNDGSGADLPIRFTLAAVFQSEGDEGFEGADASCANAERLTASTSLAGTCLIDTRSVPDGRGYDVLLRASVLQGDYPSPLFGADFPATVNVDNTPPETIAELTGATGANGWYTSEVEVELVATDALSGVDRVEYRVRGGEWTPYTGVFTIGQTGRNLLQYRAVDVAGNVESTHSTTVRVSLAPPVVTCNAAGTEGANGWFTGAVAVTCTAVTKAGPAQSFYTLDGGAPTPLPATLTVDAEGAHALAVWAVDAAGRSGEASPVELAVNVDSMAPVTTPVYTSTVGANGWHVSDVTVTFDVEDAASGAATTFASLDGAAFAPVGADGIVIDTDGVHSLRYYTVDVAGNVEGIRSADVRVDQTSPVVFPTLTGTVGANGWYRSQEVTVALAAFDDTSDVASTEYGVDGAPLQAYANAFVVSGEGAHVVRYVATDSAGNVADETLDVRIDSVAPATENVLEGVAGLNGWFKSDVTVTVTATEATSGVADRYRLVGGGSFTPYTGPFSVGLQGLTTVQSYATDVAGNVGDIRATQVKIDSVDPFTTASLTGTLGENGWYTHESVSVTLAATDASSGVDGTFYRIDGGAWQAYSGAFSVAGDGRHLVEYYSVDFAGNDEVVRPLNVNVDATLPGPTTLALDTVANAAGWHNAPTAFTLTSTDATSGVHVIRVSVNGATFTDYAGAIALADGENTITYFAIDLAGHREQTLTTVVNVDTQDPVPTLATSGTHGENGWFTSPGVDLTLTATDAPSGVASVRHVVDGGDAVTTAGDTATFSVTGDGVHAVEYDALDVADRTSATSTRELKIDSVKPTTTASLAGTVGTNDWYVTPVTVTLAGADATSGVVVTKYSFDGVSWTTHSGPFQVSTQGPVTVQFYSVDAAGLQEETRSVGFKVDTVTPATAFDPAGTVGDDGWFTSAATVTLTPTDATSGVASTTYSTDGATDVAYSTPFLVDAEGITTVTWSSTDNASNAEALNSRNVKVDTVAPTLSHEVAGTLGLDGWYTTAVTVTLSATDATSGVAAIEHSLDGADFVAGSDVTITKPGTSTLQYRARDAAGNVATSAVLSFKVDTAAPTTTGTITGAAGTNGWNTSAVTVTLFPADATSGIASTTYTLDGGAATDYAAPIDVAGEGEHTLTFSSTDAAGNVQATQTLAFKIDTVDPVTTIASETGTIGDNSWWTTAVGVTLSATDATSGVDATRYSVDGGVSWLDYVPGSTITLDAEGDNVLKFNTTDRASNEEVTLSVTYDVDTIAPAVTHTIGGTEGDNGWLTTKGTVTLTATDATSGVAGAFNSTDGVTYHAHTTPTPVDAEGTTTIHYYARDNAGLESVPTSVDVKVDTIAPTTVADLAGTLGDDGWYTTAVDVTLTATDATSGVAATHYKLNDSAFQAYTGVVTVDWDGATTVDFYSVDMAGNEETVGSVSLKVDLGLPTTAIEVTCTLGDNDWCTADDAVVNLSATASTSGIAETVYGVDVAGDPATTYVGNFSVLGEGIHTVKFRSQSTAGVWEDVKSRTVKIDVTAPAATAELSGALGTDGWFVGPVTVFVNGTDATSGLAATEYSLDGGATFARVTGNSEFVVDAQGITTVTFRAVDNAGLVGAASTTSFKIDSRAPTASDVVSSGTLGENGWYTSPVTVDLTATDDASGSGTATTEASVDGGAFAPATSVTLSTDGSHTVAYRAVDGAGNVGGTTTLTFTIDQVVPASTFETSGALGNAPWFVGPVSAWLNATDATSDVAFVQYHTGDGVWTNVTGATAALEFTEQGTTDVTFRAVDNAGLVGVESTTTFQIDSILPTATASATGEAGLEGWFTGPATVTVASDDSAGSGVATVFYRLDGGEWVAGDSFTIDDNGTFTVDAYATDVAGNDGPVHTLVVTIDQIAPASTASLAGTNGLDGWFVSPVTVTLDATTGPSGLDRIEYRTDGGAAFGPYAGPFEVDAQGATTVEFRAVDVAGKVEPIQSVTFRVDTSDPAQSHVLTGALGENDWYTGDVTVTLATDDPLPGSGDGPITYAIDDASGVTYSAPFTITGDGRYTVSYSASDVAGNSPGTTLVPVLIDGTAPTTTAALTCATQGTPHCVGPATIRFAPEDATSGVARVWSSVNGGAPVAASEITVSADGTHTVTYWAVDAAGNVEAQKALPAFTIDSVAPTTTVAFDGTSGTGDWWTSSTVTATLTAADPAPGTGVATTYYKIDGGQFFPYDGPVSVSTDARHNITFYSVDAAGLVEAERLVNIFIDSVPPQTTAGITGTVGLNDYFTSPVTLTLSTDDGGSGAAETYYRMAAGDEFVAYAGPVTVTAQGSTLIEYYAVDVAGNREVAQSREIKVDTVAPTASAAFTGTVGDADWYTSPVTVDLSFADATSGVRFQRYSVDNGQTFRSYSAPFSVTREGATGVCWTASDGAGNTRDRECREVRVDTLAPRTTAALSGSTSNGWYRSAVTVALTASDATSGVAATLVSVDGGDFVPYAGAFTVSDDGEHVVRFQSRDAAGNVETTRSVTFRVDGTAPTTTLTPAGTVGADGWYVTPVTVTLSATDAASGVAATEFSVDGGASWTAYEAPFEVAEQGTTTILYRSTDAAGNAGVTLSESFKVDSVAPATTTAPADGSVTASSLTPVTATFTGSASGFLADTARLTVDGVDAPRCVTTTSVDSITIACAPVTWREIWTNGFHAAEACVTTGAGVTHCVTSRFDVNDADSDDDGVPNSQENRRGSDFLNPYSTPDDPAAWNLRVPMNDPNGTPVTSVAALQQFVTLRFPDAEYVYAGDADNEFAPNRTADWSSVEFAGIREQAPFLVGVEPADGHAASVEFLTADTRVTVQDAQTTVPARATVDHAPAGAAVGYVGDLSVRFSVQGNDLGGLRVVTSDEGVRDVSLTLKVDGETVEVCVRDENGDVTPDCAEDQADLVVDGVFKNEFVDSHALFIYPGDAEPLTGTTTLAVAPVGGAFEFAVDVLNTATGERVVVTDDTFASFGLLDENAAGVLAASPAEFYAYEAAFFKLRGRVGDVPEFRAGEDGRLHVSVPADVASVQARAVAAWASVNVGMLLENPLTGAEYVPTGSYYNAVKNAARDAGAPGPALDAMDYTFTPLVLRGFFWDVEDGYATVIAPRDSSPLGGVTVTTPGADGAYAVDVRVVDVVTGETVKPAANAAFSFAVLDVESAYKLALLAADSGSAPASYHPADVAQFGVKCNLGSCEGVTLDADSGVVTVTIPSDRVAVGPFAVWAFVDVTDTLPGVSSAAGYYNPLKGALAEAANVAADRLDYALAPVLFASNVGAAAADPAAEDWDGDAGECDGSFPCRNADEVVFLSDPLDPNSRPLTDDDGDGIPNRSEFIPSWIMATPEGYGPFVEVPLE